MSQPFVVSIPHRLGKEEALRRLKAGFGGIRANYSQFISLHEEVWTGDRLSFRLSALGQSAGGTLDVADDHVRLEITLPWLLGKFAEKFIPAIKRDTALLLEKK
jgi:Putative polyhydroxyalkanoic acid system protein (PHA_gran_rgn)